MKEKFMELIADLFDDHNMILYVIALIAILEPALREYALVGILAYWAKKEA